MTAEAVGLSGAGRLYASGDSRHLAACAMELFDQDLPALGRQGRRYAEEHHGWDAVLERLFDVYRRVLGCHPERSEGGMTPQMPPSLRSG